MSEVECDTFIKEVKSKDSILIHSVNSIVAYEKLKNNRSKRNNGLGQLKLNLSCFGLLY